MIRMRMEMEADAKAYSALNRPQIEAGTKFVDELNLALGEKVLDMGCGTGEVTKYVAETVGSTGQVVGVDPDQARIKIAEVNFKDVSNLKFHIGCSVNGFPHDHEPYYDAHISTTAFHWVNDDEKKIYIQKAYKCLKPGGKLAILSGSIPSGASGQPGCDNDLYVILRHFMARRVYFPLTEKSFRELFHGVGLFSNVDVKPYKCIVKFPSLTEFKRWAKASTHHDFDKVSAELAEFITTAEDGSFDIRLPYIAVTASK